MIAVRYWLRNSQWKTINKNSTEMQYNKLIYGCYFRTTWVSQHEIHHSVSSTIPKLMQENVLLQ